MKLEGTAAFFGVFFTLLPCSCLTCRGITSPAPLLFFHVFSMCLVLQHEVPIKYNTEESVSNYNMAEEMVCVGLKSLAFLKLDKYCAVGLAKKKKIYVSYCLLDFSAWLKGFQMNVDGCPINRGVGAIRYI